MHIRIDWQSWHYISLGVSLDLENRRVGIFLVWVYLAVYWS